MLLGSRSVRNQSSWTSWSLERGRYERGAEPDGRRRTEQGRYRTESTMEKRPHGPAKPPQCIYNIYGIDGSPISCVWAGHRSYAVSFDRKVIHFDRPESIGDPVGVPGPQRERRRSSSAQTLRSNAQQTNMWSCPVFDLQGLLKKQI